MLDQWPFVAALQGGLNAHGIDARLDFDARCSAMTATLRAALVERTGTTEVDGDVLVQIAGQPVLIDTHAVPAGMTCLARSIATTRFSETISCNRCSTDAPPDRSTSLLVTAR
jgi:hypothetical protein